MFERLYFVGCFGWKAKLNVDHGHRPFQVRLCGRGCGLVACRHPISGRTSRTGGVALLISLRTYELRATRRTSSCTADTAHKMIGSANLCWQTSWRAPAGQRGPGSGCTVEHLGAASCWQRASPKQILLLWAIGRLPGDGKNCG